MSVTVLVKRGEYRNNSIRNQKFELVKDFVAGKKGGFITVEGGAAFGGNKIRVKVGRADYEVVAGDVTSLIAAQKSAHHEQDEEDFADEVESTETDDEIAARINGRFEIMRSMTKATTNGAIRAMIISGAPGVGKSYGVEDELQRIGFLDQIAGREPSFEIVKGAISAIGLYKILYKMKEKNKVLVFDDADGILYDDDGLNLLKAALDSSKKRRICWHAESKVLDREGIPNSFEFEASVIFITNLNFEGSKSKNRDAHLQALLSRCHYLNLTIHTNREKLVRIKDLMRKGMLNDYDFTNTQIDVLENFILSNGAKLQELSLRMVLKISDLAAVFPDSWQTVATHTCFKH